MSLLTNPFRITVHPGQRLLEQRPGRATRALGPGRHRRRVGATYILVDVRERLAPVAPQEVLVADGVVVKVTAVIRWSVVDAVAYVEHSGDPLAVVYLAVQVALRDALAALAVDEALAVARSALAPRLTAAAAEAGRPLGVAASEVVVKDVLLPAELRAAYSELVTTRQRAVAQLEAGRAETAALRSLANAAKLLDEHPALAKQRLVQALPYGSTLKLGFDGE